LIGKIDIAGLYRSLQWWHTSGQPSDRPASAHSVYYCLLYMKVNTQGTPKAFPSSVKVSEKKTMIKIVWKIIV